LSEVLAQELAALEKETDALKKIKSTMGTSEYSKQVFDKVSQSIILTNPLTKSLFA
jgi:hypothetical protein